MKTGVKFITGWDVLDESTPVFPWMAFVETRDKSIYSYWPTDLEANAAQSEMLHSVDNIDASCSD